MVQSERSNDLASSPDELDNRSSQNRGSQRRKRVLSSSAAATDDDHSRRRQRKHLSQNEEDSDAFTSSGSSGIDILNALAKAVQPESQTNPSRPKVHRRSAETSPQIDRDVFHLVRERKVPLVKGIKRNAEAAQDDINEFIAAHNARKRNRNEPPQQQQQQQRKTNLSDDKIISALVGFLVEEVANGDQSAKRFPSRSEAGNEIVLMAPDTPQPSHLSKFMAKLKKQAEIASNSLFGLGRLPPITQLMVRSLTGHNNSRSSYFEERRKLEKNARETLEKAVVLNGKRKYGGIDEKPPPSISPSLRSRSKSIQEISRISRSPKSTLILSMSNPNLSRFPRSSNRTISDAAAQTACSSYVWTMTDRRLPSASGMMDGGCLSPPSKIRIEDPFEVAAARQRVIDFREISRTADLLSELDIDEPKGDDDIAYYLKKMKKINRLDAINQWLTKCHYPRDLSPASEKSVFDELPSPRRNLGEGSSHGTAETESSFDNGSSGMSSDEEEIVIKARKRRAEIEASNKMDESDLSADNINNNNIRDNSLLLRAQIEPSQDLEESEPWAAAVGIKRIGSRPVVAYEDPNDYVSDRSTNDAEDHPGVEGKDERKKFDLKQFFEDEAEQSGSGASSEGDDEEVDEDTECADLIAAEDDEEEDEQSNAHEKLHVRRMLEEDAMELKRLKEKYLGDFGQSRKREKAYFWKDEDSRNDLNQSSSSTSSSSSSSGQKRKIKVAPPKRRSSLPKSRPPLSLNCRIGHGCVVVEASEDEKSDEPKGQKRRAEEPLLNSEEKGILTNLESQRLDQIRKRFVHQPKTPDSPKNDNKDNERDKNSQNERKRPYGWLRRTKK